MYVILNYTFVIPDPKIKEHVQNYLIDQHEDLNTDQSSADKCRLSKPSRIPTIIRSPIHTSSKSCPQSPHEQKTNKTSQIQKPNGGSSNIFTSHDSNVKKKCGFEAYMMTGDLILNLSRNQQSADILTTQFKKVSLLCRIVYFSSSCFFNYFPIFHCGFLVLCVCAHRSSLIPKYRLIV